MPTNTFEHLGTTVVSGSSTTSIVFSGLSSWTNVIFVGRIAQSSGSTRQMNVNLGGTQAFQNMYASGSSGTGVPNTTRATGAGSCDLTVASVPDGNGVSFKGHLIKQGTSRGYFLWEGGFQKTSSTMDFTVSNAFTPNNVTSVTFGFFGGVLTAGSTISAYGVMI